MTPAQRGASALPRGPVPGDLFLDPDVPDAERVTIGRDGWSAQASHVWTGTGWSRLVAGRVALVPSARPLPVRRPTGATTLTLLPGGQGEGCAQGGGREQRAAHEEPLHAIAG